MDAVRRCSPANWSAAQADQYTDSLTDAFAVLADNAEAGAAGSHIRKGRLRHSAKQPIIYCRQTEQGIEVMRVLHIRMPAARHL